MATLNRLRELLAEFGHVLPLRAVEVRRWGLELLDKLTTRIGVCLRDLLEHATRLETKALKYEREIGVHVRGNALARRAQTRPVIGPSPPSVNT